MGGSTNNKNTMKKYANGGMTNPVMGIVNGGDPLTELERYKGKGFTPEFKQNKELFKYMNTASNNNNINYNGVVGPDDIQNNHPTPFQSMFVTGKYNSRSTNEYNVHPSELRNGQSFPQSALTEKLRATMPPNDFVPVAANGMFTGSDKDDPSAKGNAMSANIDAGLGVATDLIGAFTGGGDYKAGAKGSAIGGGVGAAAGAFFGMPGVGKAVGGMIGGLIGGAKDKKDMANDASDMQRDMYKQNILMPNAYNTGNQFEEGGATGADVPTDTAPQETRPATKQINVEKGELMVDPASGQVVRKFSNPNRFTPHQKSQMKEAVGNFVQVPTNMIIIPKKDASRYERGDKLTRGSIMKRLLSDQENDPMHNVPKEAQGQMEQPQFADGGVTSFGPEVGGPAKRKINLSSLFAPNTESPQVTNAVSNFWKSTGLPDPNVKPVIDPNWKMVPDPKPIMAATARLSSDIPSIEDGLGDGVNNPQVKTAGNEKNESNLKALLRRGANNLPIYGQMAKAMQGDPFLAMNTNQGYDNAYANAYAMPDEMSIAANLNSNDQAYASASQSIDNNDTPSARAEKGELYARTLMANNQVYGGKVNADNGLKSAKLQALMGLNVNRGADVETASNNFMNEQRMDQAARDNIMFAGAANLTKNNLQADNDNTSIQALNAITHFVDINPYAKKIVGDDPKALKYIVDYIGAGRGTMDQALSSYEKDVKTVKTTSEKSKIGTTNKTTTTTK